MAEHENILFSNLLGDLDRRTIHSSEKQASKRFSRAEILVVKSTYPPFRQNFILLVPDASVPAVEMCWEISDAGIKSSAMETA